MSHCLNCRALIPPGSIVCLICQTTLNGQPLSLGGAPISPSAPCGICKQWLPVSLMQIHLSYHAQSFTALLPPLTYMPNSVTSYPAITASVPSIPIPSIHASSVPVSYGVTPFVPIPPIPTPPSSPIPPVSSQAKRRCPETVHEIDASPEAPLAAMSTAAAPMRVSIKEISHKRYYKRMDNVAYKPFLKHPSKKQPKPPCGPNESLCKYCYKVFEVGDNKRELHEQIHLDFFRSQKYQCMETGCNKQFNTNLEILRHYQNIHRIHVREENDVLYCCTLCNQVISGILKACEHIYHRSEHMDYINSKALKSVTDITGLVNKEIYFCNVCNLGLPLLKIYEHMHNGHSLRLIESLMVRI